VDRFRQEMLTLG